MKGTHSARVASVHRLDDAARKVIRCWGGRFWDSACGGHRLRVVPVVGFEDGIHLFSLCRVPVNIWLGEAETVRIAGWNLGECS